MKHKGLVLAFTLLLSAAAHAQITNGSFESGLASWAPFGGTTAITPVTAYSNQDLLSVAQILASTTGGLTQTFTLAPSTNYVFSALVAGDTVGNDAFVRFLLADSTFTTTLDQSQFLVGATPVGGAMTQINIAFNSGAVTSAALQVDAFSAGGPSPRNVFLDKVSISLAGGTTAPEPTTVALLALGALPLALRRRKHA